MRIRGRVRPVRLLAVGGGKGLPCPRAASALHLDDCRRAGGAVRRRPVHEGPSFSDRLIRLPAAGWHWMESNDSAVPLLFGASVVKLGFEQQSGPPCGNALSNTRRRTAPIQPLRSTGPWRVGGDRIRPHRAGRAVQHLSQSSRRLCRARQLVPGRYLFRIRHSRRRQSSPEMELQPLQTTRAARPRGASCCSAAGRPIASCRDGRGEPCAGAACGRASRNGEGQTPSQRRRTTRPQPSTPTTTSGSCS